MRVSLGLTAAVTALVAACVSNAVAYEVVAIADGGTIKGKASYAGNPPPKKKIIPTKDKEACGSDVREVDQIVLGPDKAVADAIVYLKQVDKGKAWEKPAKSAEIDNVKCDFKPHVQVIQAGDLDIVNADPVLHNTHGFLDKVTVFNVALPNQGQRVTRPIKRTGMIRVECDAHGWMLGWIYVAANPYYAVSSKDGSFTLTNVPAGSYTLVTWQEYTGAVETPVTVKPKEVTSVTVELKK